MVDIMREGPVNPVKIQDNTLRDGHQSIYATRMRTEDMLPIAEQMDEMGFWAMEVWGGATFDSMHRFLGEDPWERPKILKKYIKKTPFSMLLRGQNLVGYRNYADDVVRAFVDKSCEVGIDIFRVFDALNDLRNFQTCVERIKANGKHFQGAICYSLTQPRLGGDVFNLDYFVNKCKELEVMGADSICIKDMAGIVSPYDIYDLVVGPEEGHQASPAPPHPLHQRHGLHVLPQGDRGGHRHRRHLSCPLRPPDRDAGHRAARRHPAGNETRYGPRRAQAASSWAIISRRSPPSTRSTSPRTSSP